MDGQDNRILRFRGIMKIANPDWLSDFGLKTVETELNLRANERALREGERSPPQLTLEDLFGNGLLATSDNATWRKEDETKLMVLIQGEKNMPAIYMHCTRPLILLHAHINNWTCSLPCTEWTVVELESSVSVQ